MLGYLPHDTINEYRLHSFERPNGMIGEPIRGLDMGYKLPAEAKGKGLMLLDVTYRQPFTSVDPYIIFDNDGRILHAWPEEYIPGPAEIESVARRIAASIP